MSILICGSLAFDTIMTFEGRFAEQILPSQLHILNVSFLVPGLRREFGGCAGNIAYGLRQLGSPAVPLAMVGNDAQDYLARLQGLGVDTRFIGTTSRQLHGAGHDHDRPRQQPDHRLSPGGHVRRPCERPCRPMPASVWPSSRPTGATP